MVEKGKIQNRERAKQLRDYTGLRWNNITPTDIDGFIDFQGRFFIYFELKSKGKDISTGQKIAFENIIKNAKEKTFVIIGEHNQKECDNDINAADCNVVKFICNLKTLNNKWIPIKKEISLKCFIDYLIITYKDKP
jgi:hypothetical protein